MVRWGQRLLVGRRVEVVVMRMKQFVVLFLFYFAGVHDTTWHFGNFVIDDSEEIFSY